MDRARASLSLVWVPGGLGPGVSGPRTPDLPLPPVGPRPRPLGWPIRAGLPHRRSDSRTPLARLQSLRFMLRLLGGSSTGVRGAVWRPFSGRPPRAAEQS